MQGAQQYERHELLDFLRRFGATVLPWHESDECFLHLDLLRWFLTNGTREEAERFLVSFAKHSDKCGLCWNNLLAAGLQTKDREKQEIYGGLFWESLMAAGRWQGIAVESEHRENGLRFRIPYPAEIGKGVASAVEGYIHNDGGKNNWVILDVCEEAFKDPRLVLDFLDRNTIAEIQGSERKLEWLPVQWLNVFLQLPVEVKIRWEGNVKTIAQDWSFRNRHTGLVIREADDDFHSEARACAVALEQSVGGEVGLKLRELALAYDGRIPFRPFAATRLKQRGIDADRHRRVDAFGHASDWSPTKEPDPGEPLEQTEIALEQEALLDWSTKEADSRELDEDHQLFALLEPKLTPRESAIVSMLRRKNMTDQKLADSLGVCRETITRDRAKIKKKARTLLESPST